MREEPGVDGAITVLMAERVAGLTGLCAVLSVVNVGLGMFRMIGVDDGGLELVGRGCGTVGGDVMRAGWLGLRWLPMWL